MTIKGASILKDADHWGQHILMAERQAGPGAENPMRALGPDPLCSAVPEDPPDHTFGRAEGGESAFQRGDSVTLNGQLRDARQPEKLFLENHTDVQEISSPVASW